MSVATRMEICACEVKFKGGYGHDLANCRPVTLTSVVDKVMERLLGMRLRDTLRKWVSRPLLSMAFRKAVLV